MGVPRVIECDIGDAALVAHLDPLADLVGGAGLGDLRHLGALRAGV